MEGSSIKEALRGIKTSDWKKAVQWLEKAPEAVVVCNACASSCSKAHQWLKALQLTTEVLLKSLKPSDVTCNTAIQACVKAPESTWRHAIGILTRHLTQVQRDAVSWHSAADIVQRERWQLSLELLDRLVLLALLPDGITQTLRASGLKTGQRWQEGLLLSSGGSLLLVTAALSSLPAPRWRGGLVLLTTASANARTAADARALSAACRVCEAEESWPWALHLLQEVQQVSFDPYALSSTMTALSSALQWSQALHLFSTHSAQSRTRHDAVTYGAAMAAAAVGGVWEAAVRWLEEMRSNNVAPNLVIYNSAISACEEGQQWEHGLWLLQVMKKSTITPDVISYSSAVAACGWGKRWSDAVLLLDTMCQQIKTNIIAMSAAVSVCEKASRWALALHFLEQCWQLDLEVNTVTYNAAISACEKCSQWQRALILFDEMETQKNMERSLISCSVAVKVCATAKAWAAAMSLLADEEAPFAALSAAFNAAEPDGGEAGSARALVQLAARMARQREVLAAELLDNHDLLSDACLAQLRRRVWRPFWRRCSTLTRGDRAMGRTEWRLWDPVLELQIQIQRPWRPTARRAARAHAVMHDAEATAPSTSDSEIRAQGVLAWCAVRLGHLRCAGRVHEWSWQSSNLLLPVYVEHDRSPHAERQALLTWLHALRGYWVSCRSSRYEKTWMEVVGKKLKIQRPIDHLHPKVDSAGEDERLGGPRRSTASPFTTENTLAMCET
ncbi:unnamed protein product [Durusdinium trenchii]|uniref:Pentatricopeptide repeat-containing protein, chloroplastic n=1 Tax=Durusdinium trenchii TaxID=1381693 RepID=A0ABP0H970_9DINO